MPQAEQRPARGGPGRPKLGYCFEYIHYEALRRLTGQPLHKIIRTSQAQRIEKRNDLIWASNIHTENTRRKWYRVHQRCQEEPDTFGAEMEAQIRQHMEFLREAHPGAFSAQ